MVLYRIQLITSLTILRQHSLVSIICICMYQPVSHRVSLARHFSIKGTSFANKPFLQGRLRLFLPFLMVVVTHNECLWEVFFHTSSSAILLTNWLCSMNTFLSLYNLLCSISHDTYGSRADCFLYPYLYYCCFLLWSMPPCSILLLFSSTKQVGQLVKS